MRHWSVVVILSAAMMVWGCALGAPTSGEGGGSASARSSMVYVKRVGGPFPTVYKRVFDSLENNSFFVLFEPDIGRNLKLFATRWGKDYNRNHLKQIRSIVFCNGAYANQIGNADPRMLALCPLHITLIQRAGVTSILFVRPSRVAAGSPAESVALNIEQDVIRAIENGVRSLPAPTDGLAMPPVPVPKTAPPQPAR